MRLLFFLFFRFRATFGICFVLFVVIIIFIVFGNAGECLVIKRVHVYLIKDNRS